MRLNVSLVVVYDLSSSGPPGILFEVDFAQKVANVSRVVTKLAELFLIACVLKN
jgi:hypothetical protein